MKCHDLFDLITEHLNTDGVLFIHRNNFDSVSADSKGSAFKGHIVALILDIDEATQELIALNRFTNAQANHAIDILLWSTKSIDTGDGSNNNYIAAGQK